MRLVSAMAYAFAAAAFTLGFWVFFTNGVAFLYGLYASLFPTVHPEGLGFLALLTAVSMSACAAVVFFGELGRKPKRGRV